MNDDLAALEAFEQLERIPPSRAAEFFALLAALEAAFPRSTEFRALPDAMHRARRVFARLTPADQRAYFEQAPWRLPSLAMLAACSAEEPLRDALSRVTKACYAQFPDGGYYVDRRAAVVLLADIGPRLAPLATEAFARPLPAPERAALIRALARVGTPECAAPLVAALALPSHERHLARCALRLLGSRASSAPAVLVALESQLGARRKPERLLAARVLAVLPGDSGARAVAARAASRERDADVREALAAVGTLVESRIEVLEDRDPAAAEYLRELDATEGAGWERGAGVDERRLPLLAYWAERFAFEYGNYYVLRPLEPWFAALVTLKGDARLTPLAMRPLAVSHGTDVDGMYLGYHYANALAERLGTDAIAAIVRHHTSGPTEVPAIVLLSWLLRFAPEHGIPALVEGLARGRGEVFFRARGALATVPTVPVEALVPLLASPHATTRDMLALHFYRYPRRAAAAALSAAAAVEPVERVRTWLGNAASKCAACDEG